MAASLWAIIKAMANARLTLTSKRKMCLIKMFKIWETTMPTINDNVDTLAERLRNQVEALVASPEELQRRRRESEALANEKARHALMYERIKQLGNSEIPGFRHQHPESIKDPKNPNVVYRLVAHRPGGRQINKAVWYELMAAVEVETDDLDLGDEIKIDEYRDELTLAVAYSGVEFRDGLTGAGIVFPSIPTPDHDEFTGNTRDLQDVVRRFPRAELAMATDLSDPENLASFEQLEGIVGLFETAPAKVQSATAQ